MKKKVKKRRTRRVTNEATGESWLVPSGNYYDVTVTKQGRRVKPVIEETFLLPTGSYTSSTNPNPGDIIWYDAPVKQAIFRGLITRLKSLFGVK